MIGKVYEPINVAEKVPFQTNLAENIQKNETYLKSFEETCEFKKMPDSILCTALEAPYINYLKFVQVFLKKNLIFCRRPP